MNQIVANLSAAGVAGITILDVHSVDSGHEPTSPTTSPVAPFPSSPPSEVVMLEVICTDQDAERFVPIIQESGRTGVTGDGMICVSDVSRVIRIRDGASGVEILARSI